MKKIVGIIAAAALCAGAAMAQDAGIRFGSWSSLNMSLVGYNGEDIVTTTSGASWGGGNARIGVDLIGVSEYAGFQICIDGDPAGGSNVGIHDLAFGWVKPFDFLRFDIGKVRDQTLERGAGFCGWDWMRAGGNLMDDDAPIFDMIGSGDGSDMHSNGIIARIDPIDGLHIGIGVLPGDVGAETWKAEDAFAHRSAISAGYTVEGLGTFKAGVWMRDTGYDDNFDDEDGPDAKFWCKPEVAFDLTAVENLNLSIGVKVPTGFVYTGSCGSTDPDWKKADGTAYDKSSEGDLIDIVDGVKAGKTNGTLFYKDGGGDPDVSKGVYTAPFEFNVYGNYQVLDNLKLHALIVTHLYKYGYTKNDKFDDDIAFGLRAGIGAELGLGENWTVILDGRFCTAQYNMAAYTASEADSSKDSDPGFSFLVGIKKGVSNGEIGIGFEGAMNDGGDWWSGSSAKSINAKYNGEEAEADSFKFCVPIMMHVNF